MMTSDGEQSWPHTNLASPRLPWRRPICRLGLATRGDSNLATVDIHHALERGINFLNWCGSPDAMSQAIAELGAKRSRVVICVQFEARSAGDAKTELAGILGQLRTDYIDVLTFYYVEEAAEWQEICAPGGSLDYCAAAQRDGAVRLLGVTSHQRRLATDMARSGLLDLLMIRYNAAHRGAEKEVFPITAEVGMPVVVYTCLRWGALFGPTPEDPRGFVVPRAPAWYRFALQTPAATVALMAPNNRAELLEDITVLDAPGRLSELEYATLAEHGRRVRQHGGSFP